MGNITSHARRKRISYVVMDYFMTSIAIFFFNIFRFTTLHTYDNNSQIIQYILSEKLVEEQIVIPILLLGIYWLSGYYNHVRCKSRAVELFTTFLTAIFNSVLIFFLLLLNDTITRTLTNYILFIGLFLLLFCFTYSGRLLLTEIFKIKTRARNEKHPTLVIGNSAESRNLLKSIANSRDAALLDIIGFVVIPNETNIIDGAKLYQLKDLEKICIENNISQVIIAPQMPNDTLVLDVLDALFPLGIAVKIMPDTLSFVTSSIRINDILGEPLIDLTHPPLTEFELNLKLAFDKVFAFLFLILLSPIYIIIGCLIKLNSDGPIIYSQTRIGAHRKPFKIYKFRTMYKDSEAHGPQLSSPNDQRITKLGAILRKYRIDELPQFLNVLKGDMSIVGPRPEREFYINKIVKYAPYYKLVFQVKPGITSWGMVKYGYASSIEQMVQRTKFDLIYITNMSIMLDIKIIIYTIRTILIGAGM